MREPPAFLLHPAPYVGWAAVVVAGLMAAWAIDPYVLGGALMVVAPLTVLVAILAAWVALCSGVLSRARRWGIFGSMIPAGIAIVLSIVALRRTRWA